MNHAGVSPERLWNGASGQAWVDLQDLLDALFAPFADHLVATVREDGARHVLDIGCGTGATTLALAKVLPSNGRSTGVDISEPMIAAARKRAEREKAAANFICADAQDHAFPPDGFDTLVSRFGVMFFTDPVKAFANLRHAATQDGKLRVIAWRSPDDNPFMTTAERAVAPLLPNLPVRQLNAPGQFAFADRQRVRRILEESGWTDVDIHPLDLVCSMPEADLMRYAMRLGPLGLVFQNLDEQTRAQAADAVRTAFEPYIQGADVRFTAACWMVSARA